MSDQPSDATAPQTSGAAAPGTEGGPEGDRPDHLPRADDGGDAMRRAQEDMATSGIEHPIEGEGTTEEGRRQAVETVLGPGTEAGTTASSTRGPAANTHGHSDGA